MFSRPEVALLSVGELFGGVERHLLGMCEWLQAEGIQPLLILFHDKELAAQARKMGVSPVILENSGSFDLFVPRRLAKLLRSKNVDIVHAHGYRAVVTAALARHFHRFAVVRTVHGLVEPSPVLTVTWAKSHVYDWLEKKASDHTSALVCHVTDELRNLGPGGAGRAEGETVYNGIKPLDKVSYPRPDDLEREVFHFAAVGRVSPVKSLETGVLAMASLDKEAAVVLNILGTGPSMAGLRALADEHGLNDRVRFLGFRDNVYDYLAHVDALVMPSRHEGLPYTILEAMSLGTPIIASRVGGLAEVLEHECTALLVEPGDVDGLAGAMKSVMTDPGLASGLGVAAREKQSDSLTLEAMGSRYWRFYLEHWERGTASG